MKYERHTIVSEAGAIACTTNYGARICSICVPNKSGELTDVVLGHKELENYTKGEAFFGASVGRSANRIRNAQFNLNGKTYHLDQNIDGGHHHGGSKGFHTKFWMYKADISHSQKAVYELLSEDGDQGYPGNLTVQVTFEWVDDFQLMVTYTGECDQETIFNPTIHPFFNLNGHQDGTVYDHQLQINGRFYCPLADDMIPTGEILSVEDTPFDFRSFKSIGEMLNKQHPQTKLANGLDHNIALDKSKGDMREAATLIGDKSNIRLKIYTTEVGLQVYSSNFLDSTDIGKDGAVYAQHGAICLETQHFPDSPNQSHFISSMIPASKLTSTKTLFEFTTLL